MHTSLKADNNEKTLLKNRTINKNFSYRHFDYSWAVAREGGMTRAAGGLGMAVQTVSKQVRELERSLGYALPKPGGRGVALTPAGGAAGGRHLRRPAQAGG